MSGKDELTTEAAAELRQIVSKSSSPAMIGKDELTTEAPAELRQIVSKSSSPAMIKAAAELRSDFRTLAQTLDDMYTRCNAIRAVGNVAAVAGGAAVLVAGAAATVSTFGLAAVPLAAGATTLATTGGLASGGASLVSYFVENVNLKRTEAKWKSFKMMYFDVAEIPSQTEAVPGAAGDIQMDTIHGAAQDSGDMLNVRQFLKFFKIFFNEDEMAEFINQHHLCRQASEWLGIKENETVSGVMERVLTKIELRAEEAGEIKSAIQKTLNCLNFTKEVNRSGSNTPEELLAQAAKFVAENCTLTPARLGKIFLRLHESVPNAEKKQMLYAGVGHIMSWAKGTKGAAAAATEAVAKAPSTAAGGGWLRAGLNSAGSLAQRGTEAARSAVSSTSKTLAGQAMARGADAYSALKPLASRVAQRGAAWGQAVLPSSVVSGGTNLYSSSRSLAAGLWSRGCSVSSRVKAATTGGLPATAASKEAGRVSGAVTSVGRPVLVLNALILPLSVYDLITVSVELRDKKKSRTGDYLREVANMLTVIVDDGDRKMAY